MRIAVWPDGTWCELDQLGEMSHMGDDFATFTVTNEDEAEEIAARCGRDPEQ